MLHLVLHAALAAEAPEPLPVAVEPVLEEAKRDVRAIRAARTAQVLMIALPGAMVATAFVVGRSKSETPQFSLAANGLLFSGIGMAIAANIFQKKAINSRQRLVVQGLAVPRTPPVVVPVLSVLGVAGTAVMLATLVQVDKPWLTTTGATVTAISFGACFGLSTLQLEWNRTARKRAGWISVAPTRIDRSTGLAVVGSW